MKKNTKRILKYTIEFLIVAFGVFLGIYVSEKQNEHKITLEKENSINYIFEELENNRVSLKKSIKYHELIDAQIDSITPTLSKKDLFANYVENEKFKHSTIKGWSGIRLANLDDTAFETAKINGIIKEYDLKFIQNISKIYKAQEVVIEFGESILTKMINTNSSTKVVDVLGAIDLLTTDLLSNEKALLEAIEKVQTLYKKDAN